MGPSGIRPKSLEKIIPSSEVVKNPIVVRGMSPSLEADALSSPERLMPLSPSSVLSPAGRPARSFAQPARQTDGHPRESVDQAAIRGGTSVG